MRQRDMRILSIHLASVGKLRSRATDTMISRALNRTKTSYFVNP
jgi:hypothetical protein